MKHLEIKTFKILKRNGKIEEFNSNKITTAIRKAFVATDFNLNEKKLNEITQNVTKRILSQDKYPCIETIQNYVEEELFNQNYFKVARNYIAYREKHSQLRNNQKAYIDAIDSVSEYVTQEDWRINANANQGYSLGGLILNSSGKMTANYWLKHIYAPEIGNAHLNGDYHIHDLDMLSGYCAGWSLRNLLNEGFNGVANRAECEPPKHLLSAIGQIVNFFGTLQNEWAGAQAFSSFDTFLAPYIYKDKLDYKQVKQIMQQLIFNLNIPSRWGCQTPFTNLTFDWTIPDDLKDQIPMCNNNPLLKNEPTLTYKDFSKEMEMINKAYLEVMYEGDSKGRVFTFPIPTYNITKEFDWNGKNTDLLFKVTSKYGLPYFQNFIGSQYKKDENGNLIKDKNAYKPGAVRSMCCRLQLDLNELLKRGGGLFGSAEMTGSIGVVTINAARLGYLYKGNKKALYDALFRLMNLAKESLEVKRKIVNKYMKQGLYPFTKRYLGHLRSHFSTIGINGVNEMIRNYTNDKENIASNYGIIFAEEFLDYMRETIIEFQNETGNLYNLEATPAEGTTYRFAKEDKKRFPNIIQSGCGNNIYYTNSSQLPAGHTDDPFEALELQDNLQKKYTGGTVLHFYLGEQFSSIETCKKFIKKVLSNYRLPYITISPVFSICPKHGHIIGEHHTCPTCSNECEVWSRVMGYYRPISQFNIGKKGEYAERINFTEENPKGAKEFKKINNIQIKINK